MRVFVYGSLLHPDEIRKQFGKNVDTAEAILQGYKRHYGQLSDVRTDADGNFGNVLTVTRKEDFSCNGVLVSGLDSTLLDQLRRRESGYNIKELSSEKLEVENTKIDSDPILVSVGRRSTDNWNPLTEYMEICEKGARARGEEFHRSFIESTYRFPETNQRPHQD
jgi:cation transport regulator ChaC